VRLNRSENGMNYTVPDSLLKRFLVRTKYLRYLSRRLHLQYTLTLSQETRVVLRFGTDDTWIAREMFESRPYEKYFRPEPGQTVVDAGANIGCFTLRSAELVGTSGRILAFEPSSRSYSILKKNAKKNKLKSILTMNMALGNQEGRITLWVHDMSAYDSTLRAENEKARLRGGEKIPVRKLDNVLDELRIKELNFIKLDTEGAELDILRGGQACLNRFRPRLAGEAHPGWSDSGATILEYLRGFNYKGIVEPYAEGVEFFYAWPNEDHLDWVEKS